jgi:hypothetical protein
MGSAGVRCLGAEGEALDVRDRILASAIRRLRVAVHQVERPVGAGRVFVWHTDATRVDHALPCDRALELRMRVTAGDDVGVDIGEQVSDPLFGVRSVKMSTSLRVSAGRFVWHYHIVEHEGYEMIRPYMVGPMA